MFVYNQWYHICYALMLFSHAGTHRLPQTSHCKNRKSGWNYIKLRFQQEDKLGTRAVVLRLNTSSAYTRYFHSSWPYLNKCRERKIEKPRKAVNCKLFSIILHHRDNKKDQLLVYQRLFKLNIDTTEFQLSLNLNYGGRAYRYVI